MFSLKCDDEDAAAATVCVTTKMIEKRKKRSATQCKSFAKVQTQTHIQPTHKWTNNRVTKQPFILSIDAAATVVAIHATWMGIWSNQAHQH